MMNLLNSSQESMIISSLMLSGSWKHNQVTYFQTPSDGEEELQPTALLLEWMTTQELLSRLIKRLTSTFKFG